MTRPLPLAFDLCHAAPTGAFLAFVLDLDHLDGPLPSRRRCQTPRRQGHGVCAGDDLSSHAPNTGDCNDGVPGGPYADDALDATDLAALEEGEDAKQVWHDLRGIYELGAARIVAAAWREAGRDPIKLTRRDGGWCSCEGCRTYRHHVGEAAEVAAETLSMPGIGEHLFGGYGEVTLNWKGDLGLAPQVVAALLAEGAISTDGGKHRDERWETVDYTTIPARRWPEISNRLASLLNERFEDEAAGWGADGW